MKLRNSTDLPDERLRQFIRHCCPSGVTKTLITVSNYRHRGGRGRAWWFQNRILLRVQTGQQHYAGHGPHGGYLGMPPMTREEVALFLIAHELRHLWQRRVPKGRRVWGARGQFSERDADAYAFRAVRTWRRGESM